MRSRGQAPVGLRLVPAFVTVAVLAVALVAVLTVVFTGKDIAALVQQRRDVLVRSLAINAESAYRAAGAGWAGADLSPALRLAATTGTQAAILDTSGRVVASTLTGAAGAAGASAIRQPLTAGGRRIGTLLVRFTSQSLVGAADRLRLSLVHAVIGAAGLAALLALAVAVAVSRRITRPVRSLIESARAMSRGDWHVRAGDAAGAPAELRELAATFDQLAGNLVAEDRLRRELVADVAHELRTPIAVLRANTEGLVDGLLPATPEQMASLHEEVLRLGRMVEDVQTLAAAEAAALQLQLRRCDLAEVAATAAEDWEASFAATGVRFLSETEQAPVLADQMRLHQIITNLLSNALKFTPPGGLVRMTVCRGGDRARLEVSDSGPGIGPDDLPHVFDRWWRGTGTGQTTGSGIGLAVAAELAKAHRGTIEVASEPGEGSRFTLSLPLAERSG